MEKSQDAFRTIGEAAIELDVPQHVLRFWETRFSQIRPMKRGGGRRYYRPVDMDLLRTIRGLLYGEGYTIKGVQKLLKEQGAKALVAASQAGGVEAPVIDAFEAAEPGETAARHVSPHGGASALRAALAELDAARRILAAAR